MKGLEMKRRAAQILIVVLFSAILEMIFFRKGDWGLPQKYKKRHL